MVQVWNSETKKLEFEEWPREEETVLFADTAQGRNDLAAYKEPAGYTGAKPLQPTPGYVFTTAPMENTQVNFNPQAYVEAFPKSKAAKICESAAKLIDGPKNSEHGDREDTFGSTAELWSTYFGIEIEPHQVAWAMVLLKIAREGNGHNADNSLDAVGYAAIAGELAENDAGC